MELLFKVFRRCFRPHLEELANDFYACGYKHGIERERDKSEAAYKERFIEWYSLGRKNGVFQAYKMIKESEVK